MKNSEAAYILKNAAFLASERTGIIVQKAVDMAVNALEKTQWVPVSERLPEEDGEYLVCGEGKVWICGFLTLYYVRGWDNDVRNPRVIAWMPLPEPYERGEDESVN